MPSNIDLVALCYEFPPCSLAGAIWTEKLLAGLKDLGWRFEVITASPGGAMQGVPVHFVPNPGRPKWLSMLDRAKVFKFCWWGTWPDDAIYWNDSVVRCAGDLIRQRKPRMIVNFMMPYGAGMAGERLKVETGLPLIYCFSDSLSCTDMHPSFPTWFHYRRALQLEDRYVRAADAVVYVSRFNADVVCARQSPDERKKFHVIRLGADLGEFSPSEGAGPDPDGPLRIVYTGSMGGWYEWHKRRPFLSKCRRFWDDLGRYRLTRLDYSTHAPVYIGKAVQQVLKVRPDWTGKVFIDIYGSRIATEQQIANVLEATDLTSIVRVHGPQSRAEIVRQARTADLLFTCIQNRSDGSYSGRTSAKKPEYLMTNRPILAAIPRGENWDDFCGYPGVFLVPPDDVEGMASAISSVCEAKFDRKSPIVVDRSGLHDDLSYAHRAKELEAVLQRFLARPR